VQSHGSFANTTICYGQRVLGLTERDITLAVPKLFFGYATGSNLFFPFSVGAVSALFPEKSTAETLFQKIKKFRPTVLVNVPTMVHQMVSHPDATQQNLSSLRLATSAGEALPVELYERWKQTFGVELLDGLGHGGDVAHLHLQQTRRGEAGHAGHGRAGVRRPRARRLGPRPAGRRSRQALGARRLPGDRLLAADGEDQGGVSRRVVCVGRSHPARCGGIFHVLWPRR